MLLRTALEQKKADEKKEYGAIDYDAPVESEEKTIGLGTKVEILQLSDAYSDSKCMSMIHLYRDH